MIITVNNKNAEVASDILNVQLPAYRVEAEIIGFDGIPPLRDTVQSIMECDEQFVGYMTDEKLVGFVSYHTHDEGIDICRLVVHPSHFRKGIAKQLLAHMMSGPALDKKVQVSTGTKNVPAKTLYESFGFKEIGNIEVAPGVFITRLER
ncbi:GNAT family N-acetyltransferase [Paenibacillus sp. GSMTC-2017]|uniref:GNAT family N-acetyltransferase n=1 Tax=Paenibacillus sp. GSMTC-2017 TaxID=2794350 RepID=UPI0018D9750B|nr:GNAT family N-acetyltransferase [Paenibacillus sp. GSMTC-2017]MBH5319887.1 GNAT family N-acetyltransferase [Paenibacillus sp. GSMTC-2017]